MEYRDLYESIEFPTIITAFWGDTANICALMWMRWLLWLVRLQQDPGSYQAVSNGGRLCDPAQRIIGL